MAAISLKPGAAIDWAIWHRECTTNLPVYARPVFVRIQCSLQMTSTFKHQKRGLVNDAFDPNNLKENEKLFIYSSKDGTVTELTKTIYKDINDGVLKF